MAEPTKTPVVKVAEYPDGYHDAADLFQRHPEADAAWTSMIANAKTVPSWMIAHLDDRYDIDSPNGASDACADIVDVLLAQPPVARARYIRELAAKIGEEERVVRQTLNELVRERGDYYTENPEQRPTEAAMPRLEELLGDV